MSTDVCAAAEAVCDALWDYERVKHDNERQLDAWERVWLHHKVWRAARAAANTPTLTDTP